MYAAVARGDQSSGTVVDAPVGVVRVDSPAHDVASAAARMDGARLGLADGGIGLGRSVPRSANAQRWQVARSAVDGPARAAMATRFAAARTTTTGPTTAGTRHATATQATAARTVPTGSTTAGTRHVTAAHAAAAQTAAT